MATYTVKSPITNQTLYEIQDTSSTQIQTVYKTAKTSFEVIRNLPIDERLYQCQKIQHYIIENKESIIDRIIQENGKSRFDCLVNEIFSVAATLDYYHANAKKILRDKRVSTPLVLAGKSSKIIYEPIGPVLIISPWNYPLYQTLVPCLSAFIAGNSIIFKPSEITPLKGLIEDILDRSGFMKEAIQVVYGGAETGSQLIDHKPAKIFFIGSVNTGKAIMSQAANHLIPVELELGGKDPMIVFDDVNVERSVNGALWGGFMNSGQTCISVERLYVQSNLYDSFVDILTKKIRQINCSGQSNDEYTDIGKMTSERQVEIVHDHVADAVAKGAQVIMGGKRNDDPFYYPPTLLVDVDHSMIIMTEETFGPVLPIMKFDSEDDVIQLANDTPYGLAASVWSNDRKRAERVAKQLTTGNVSINNVILTVANPALSFGGIKNSGFGRYKGEFGLHAFSNVKSILADWRMANNELHWYPYTPIKYKTFSTLLDSLYSKSKSWLKFALTGIKVEWLNRKERL
jgi:acyl-CoA reductase-like NAD-dependent aldehyde dehydrogenase